MKGRSLRFYFSALLFRSFFCTSGILPHRRSGGGHLEATAVRWYGWKDKKRREQTHPPGKPRRPSKRICICGDRQRVRSPPIHRGCSVFMKQLQSTPQAPSRAAATDLLKAEGYLRISKWLGGATSSQQIKKSNIFAISFNKKTQVKLFFHIHETVPTPTLNLIESMDKDQPTRRRGGLLKHCSAPSVPRRPLACCILGCSWSRPLSVDVIVVYFL